MQPITVMVIIPGFECHPKSLTPQFKWCLLRSLCYGFHYRLTEKRVGRRVFVLWMMYCAVFFPQKCLYIISDMKSHRANKTYETGGSCVSGKNSPSEMSERVRRRAYKQLKSRTVRGELAPSEPPARTPWTRMYLEVTRCYVNALRTNRRIWLFFIRHFVLQYCACVGIWFTHCSYWNRVNAWIIENMDDCSVIFRWFVSSIVPFVVYDTFICCYLSSWLDACCLQSAVATDFSWVRHVQSPFPVLEMKSIAFVNFFCFLISLISQIDGEDSSSPNDLCPIENQKVGHLSVELHIDSYIVMH